MVAGALKISGRKKAEIEAQLDAEGYDRMAAVRRGVRISGIPWVSFSEPPAGVLPVGCCCAGSTPLQGRWLYCASSLKSRTCSDTWDHV